MNFFRRYFRNISHQRGTAQFLLLCLRHSQQWLHHKVLSKVAVICVIIVDREDMMTHLKDCLVESPSMAGGADGENEVEGVKVGSDNHHHLVFVRLCRTRLCLAYVHYPWIVGQRQWSSTTLAPTRALLANKTNFLCLNYFYIFYLRILLSWPWDEWTMTEMEKSHLRISAQR